FIDEREEDLNELIPQDFLIRYSSPQWDDLIRFIRALTQRIERGLIDPVSDKKREAEWKSYFLQYEGLKREMSVHASKEKREALDEFFWMLQEYRVALFGGGVVKTKQKVSPKRLDDKVAQVRSLV
ncbi:MAG: DUF3418 domain-containing protein, partial [Spirochaetales bacterium]|nr:DUF3418 domain-containing protein [Spirochaetales bacterium]